MRRPLDQLSAGDHHVLIVRVAVQPRETKESGTIEEESFCWICEYVAQQVLEIFKLPGVKVEHVINVSRFLIQSEIKQESSKVSTVLSNQINHYCKISP